MAAEWHWKLILISDLKRQQEGLLLYGARNESPQGIQYADPIWDGLSRDSYLQEHVLTGVQFSSVAQLRPTLSDPMNRSTPGLTVHHQLPEFTQTHVHRVSDAIQPSHPVVSFSSCPQSLSASESFPMSQLFAWGGQSIGVSALASFLPKKSQGCCPSEWTGWISLQSRGLSRVGWPIHRHQHP